MMKTAGEIVVNGEQMDLRERRAGMCPNAPETPPLLVIALDGVSRDLLYDMLRRGKLPKLARLLGGDRLHAAVDAAVVDNGGLVTAFSGVPPAQHGATGNEFFVRETRTHRIVVLALVVVLLFGGGGYYWHVRR